MTHTCEKSSSTRRGALIALVLAACVAAPSGSAQAGGLEFPDLGTVAIGRGAAFVARADNASAFYYNPAGLSKSSGINLLLSANLAHVGVDYQRTGSGLWRIDDANGPQVAECPTGEICIADPAEDNGPYPDSAAYAGVSNDGSIGPMPLLVFSWGDAFDVEGLAIAAGLVPPSSYGTPHYPADGPQRYAIIKAHHMLFYPGVGASYAFNRYLQVGAVFLSGVALLEQTQAIRPMPVANNDRHYNENLGGDAMLTIDANDGFVPTGMIGVLSNPLDWLEIGATVKFPAKVEAEGIIKYKAPTLDIPDSSLVPGRDKAQLKQSFPWVVRVGARYIHDYFDIEADFVWENWSSMKGFDILLDADIDDGLGSSQAMPDAHVPKNFRDCYSVRLGGDVEVWPEHIAVRIGGFYQSSAYPENYDTFSLDFPIGEQFGLGGGLTWHAFDFLDINAGYLHIFQLDVRVEDGILQQQGLPWTSPEGEEVMLGNTVNNGKYEVAYNIFGISLEGHF